MSHSRKTRVSIKIYNRPYTVIGEESSSDVQLIASLVDQKMREIKENNNNLDVADLAVLTAVNTMNDYLKLKEDYATLLGTLRKKEDN